QCRDRRVRGQWPQGREATNTWMVARHRHRRPDGPRDLCCGYYADVQRDLHPVRVDRTRHSSGCRGGGAAIRHENPEGAEGRSPRDGRPRPGRNVKMNGQSWLVTIGAAILSGSFLPSLFRATKRLFTGTGKAEADRLEAEARKLNAEADEIDWRRMRDEITRLEERVARQDKRIAELERLDDERTKRETCLQRENKRLTLRVKGLEDILLVKPLPDDMKALLDDLDRKTAKLK